ncbi:MAG: DUF11 domain-containing protein [Phycisphaerales bacterium]|nr:MAG: DUF11 domain-containing protein [Phycisphaerales bacterium]
MKNDNTNHVLKARILTALLAVTLSMNAVTPTAMGKSLYVNADIKGASLDRTQPVQAYDIGVDGTLTFQAQHDIPHRRLGAVGMAIDADSGYVFITYEHSDTIQLLDPVTMADAGTTTAPDASDLAGIVYDHKKKLLYTVDRGQEVLYVYDWDPQTATLTHVEGSPFTLRRAAAYGIALDEIDDLLYVANASNSVRVYSTSDWELVNTITLSHMAISIAVDVKNGFVYTGAGYAGDTYLTQYHLPTGTEAEVQVEPDAGVMGLAVDSDTGLVYMSTGRNGEPGGDNLLAYDAALNRIDLVPAIGNPTGLAIPGRDIGYNPLNLRKTVVRGATENTAASGMPSVGAGDTMTYGIAFDNNNDFTVTGVSIVDTLPTDVTFITADDDGVNGHYDAKTHTYRWSYPALPPGSATVLELTVQVENGVDVGTVITNSVTINSNETPSTTTSLDVLVANNALNVTKTIFGAVEGQIAWVDINAPLTYTICFDNNDNDFPVTDVSIVDILPDEVSFVSADGGKAAGQYDPMAHTYTWSYPFLEPGTAMCLGMVVNVNPDVAPGTTFANAIIVNSNETPPSTTGVDATTYYNPLNLSKAIVGAVEGQPTWVAPGEKMTYEIHFDNKGNDSAVTNVSVVDALPTEVSFVKADGDGVFGHYDSKTHTYTWTYASVPATKSETHLELVVKVNEDAPAATIISNSVTIDSDETRPTTAKADAITNYKALNLSKTVVGGVVGEIEWVDVNDLVTYSICFDNDNDSAVTNVSIVDTLPKQLIFVEADGDGVFGEYDAKTHVYKWSYPSLPPGSSTCLELVALVKDTPPATTITNTVTIDSNETLPTTVSVDVVTGESPLEVESMRIMPEIIRRSGETYDVQAVLILPPGIGRDDVKDVLPTLYPGRVRAKRQIVYGTASRAKVIALFDKAELMSAISDYGQVTLKVVGKLKAGRSFSGEATVYITKHTGS